jgi:hypothetical protein
MHRATHRNSSCVRWPTPRSQMLDSGIRTSTGISYLKHEFDWPLRQDQLRLTGTRGRYNTHTKDMRGYPWQKTSMTLEYSSILRTKGSIRRIFRRHFLLTCSFSMAAAASFTSCRVVERNSRESSRLKESSSLWKASSKAGGTALFVAILRVDCLAVDMVITKRAEAR